MPNVEIVIEGDGTVRHLVDANSERIGQAIAGEKIDTRRASHVETWSSLTDDAKKLLLETRLVRLKNGVPHARVFGSTRIVDIQNYFWADLTPCNGPIQGPFVNYEQAIGSEIKWLQSQNLPMPKEDNAD